MSWLEFLKLEKVWGIFMPLIAEPLKDFENSSEDYFEKLEFDYDRFDRHPNLEYDDQEPDEDGLGFSSYHVLEW